MANAPLNQPVVGINAAPGGNGDWLVGKDGEVFAFGASASTPRRPAHRSASRSSG